MIEVPTYMILLIFIAIFMIALGFYKNGWYQGRSIATHTLMAMRAKLIVIEKFYPGGKEEENKPWLEEDLQRWREETRAPIW